MFYLCGTIPALWLLEMDRIKKYDALNKNENITSEVQELANIEGVRSNLDILKTFLDSDLNELNSSMSFSILLIMI